MAKNDDGSHEGSSSSSSSRRPSFRPFLIKERNPKPKSAGSHRVSSGYKYDGIFKWFAVGLDDHNQLPPSVHLHSVSGENLPGKTPVNRRVLFSDSDERLSRRPWEHIAEDVLPELLSSFVIIRNIVKSDDHMHEKVISEIIARFGKVMFRGKQFPNWIPIRPLLSEDSLRPLRRSFYTNIPESYVEYLNKEGASKSGLEFEHEKEVYRLYFSEVTKPGKESMRCKCRVLKEDGKLHLHKIEHDHTRYMIRDISCLEKNLDMRLDLSTKRSKHNLSDEDMQSLKNLISSAIVDPNLKIGLRWPVSENKFCLTEVWRITQKTFKCSSLTLHIRDVFRSKNEESTREVVVKFKGLASQLLKKDADGNLISEMLKDDLKVLWDNILCCERFPKEIILD